MGVLKNILKPIAEFGGLVFYECNLTMPLPDSPPANSSPTVYYIPEVDRELVLQPGEVCINDLYTLPEFRCLRDSGAKKIYAYVRSSNHDGLRAARHLMAPIGRLWYLKFRFGRGIVMGNVQLSFKKRGSDSCAVRVLDSRSRSAASSDVVGGTLSSSAAATRSGQAVAALTSSTETRG